MLSRFGVQNYKSLANVNIPLTKIHVLIGQNDSGKTSLLEAIHALCRTTRPGVQLHDAFEGRWEGRELVYLGAESPEIAFSSQFPAVDVASEKVDGYGLTATFRDIAGRECFVDREWYTDTAGGKHEIPRFSPQITSVSYSRRYEADVSWRARLEAIAGQLHATNLYRFEPKTMAVPASIEANRRFRMESDGFGLATVLDDILGYNADRFIELSNSFCGFFPEFRRVRVQTEMASQRSYDPTGLQNSHASPGKGIYFETRNGGAVRAQQASDGAILFLGFLSLLYLPEPPKILLIEEPEKGVYPKRLDEIVGLLRRVIATREECESPQIIITTHSPYVLSYFAPEEVTLMSRRGDRAIARPLRDAPHILDRLDGGEFYLGELWYNLDEEELFQDVGSEHRA